MTRPLDHLIFAPVRVSGKGAFSDTDLVTYREIAAFEQIEFDEKSRFSPKEIVFPITQTLFYYTEEGYAEPKVNEKGIIIFCRPCDVNAFKRLDEIFLNNGDSKDNDYDIGVIGMVLPVYDAGRCIGCEACVKNCRKVSTGGYFYSEN